jgi:hypothetical protein
LELYEGVGRAWGRVGVESVFDVGVDDFESGWVYEGFVEVERRRVSCCGVKGHCGKFGVCTLMWVQ